ncbi:MAG: hypothetical protein WBP26_05165 [Candidatus Saccharimonadales bacterium]
MEFTIPEDPIAHIIDSVRDRDQQRTRAVELALNRVDTAATPGEDALARRHLGTALAAQAALWRSFPEVFPVEEVLQR